MRNARLVFAAVLAGCGGSGPAIPPIANAPSAAVINSGSGSATYNIVKEERRHRLTLAGSIQGGSTAVHTAYKALGIPATTLTTAPRVIGNERFVMRRQLAGKLLSTYLDCGTTPAGVLANFYRIHSAVLTSVEPAGKDSVVIETRLTAQGFSNEGASGGAVDCSSHGTLERRLLDEAKMAAQVRAPS
jgi:hypothetical protein